MTIRPQIPAVEGLQDPRAAEVLRAVKATVDLITGRSPGREQIKLLGQNFNIYGVANKVNEVITQLQSGPTAGQLKAPTATVVTTSTGWFNNLNVGPDGLIIAGSNAAYLTENQLITLSGDVLGTGTQAVVTTISNNVVNLQKLTPDIMAFAAAMG